MIYRANILIQKYTDKLLNESKGLFVAKGKASSGLGEMIEIATNRRWKKNEKAKHKSDAKYGWYRYNTRFAIPAYNNAGEIERYKIYRATLLIRNDANGKKYLYDLIKIKQEKKNQLKALTSKSFNTVANAQSKGNEGSPSLDENIISQTEPNINTSTQKNRSRDDIIYSYAVKNGDMQKAQRMVDEAAEKAFADSKVRDKYGKLRKVYHWTNSDFTEFDTGRSGSNQGKTHGDGIYISTSKDEFSYAGKKLLTLYADISDPFEMKLSDGQARYILNKYAATKHNLEAYNGLYYNHALSALKSQYKVMDYLKEYAEDNDIKVSDILTDLGYNGVHDGSEWVAFSSEQLKSADPITYDKNNDVIPLSDRFDTSKKDIRYKSRSDSDYLAAVDRGDMDTAQKMVDEAAEKRDIRLKTTKAPLTRRGAS